MKKLAILGPGVVGGSCAEILLRDADLLERNAGEQLELSYVLARRALPDRPYKDKVVTDFSVIEHDADVFLVIETIGGCGAALEYVRRALAAGKHVVTANKQLIAEHGAELLALAKANGVSLLFEASVGGGIPVLHPLSQCLGANEIYEVRGILNGTTNFILTKMIRDHMNFSEALALAQKLGYAERDPRADVEGDDACRKICILASLAFGTHVYPESVHTEGITKITLEDVDFADVWGGVIKLIGSVKMLESGQVHIMVCPMFVQRGSQLASVDDVFNGIMVRGDATGDVVFYGKGAGKLPTASAVVADVIDCVKHFKARKYLFWDEAKPNYVADFGAMETSAYVHAAAESGDAAFAAACAVFGNPTRLLAKKPVEGEAGFTVSGLTEDALAEKLRALEARGVRVLNRIRISDY